MVELFKGHKLQNIRFGENGIPLTYAAAILKVHKRSKCPSPAERAKAVLSSSLAPDTPTAVKFCAC